MWSVWRLGPGNSASYVTTYQPDTYDSPKKTLIRVIQESVGFSGCAVCCWFSQKRESLNISTALVVLHVLIHHCMCSSDADLLIITIPSNAHTEMVIWIPSSLSWLFLSQTDVIRIMVLHTWSFIFISNSKAQMSVFSSPTQQMLMNPLVFWEIKDRCCFYTSWPKAGPARDERCSSFHRSFLPFHSSALWKHFNYAVSIENASLNL